MQGVSATTGKPLDGEAHLVQSIRDILTTPLGSRCGRRDYGSLVPELIDGAMNAAGRLRLFAASALAIARWEPRVRIAGFALEGGADGAFSLAIDARRLDLPASNGRARLLVPLRSA